MNSIKQLFLIALVVLAASSLQASVNIHLDNSQIIQGAPLTGFVEVVADGGEDIHLLNRVSVLEDGIAFFITPPDGVEIEISYKTYGTTSYTLLSGVEILSGEKLFFPLFLLFWDHDFIFEQVGEYTIEIHLTTDVEDPNLIIGKCTVNVEKGDGQISRWKEALPRRSSVFASFRIGNYESINNKAALISDLYPPIVDQMFVYTAGGITIPEFFNYYERGQDITEETMRKVVESYSLGTSHVQKTKLGREMWEYIGLAIDEFSKGRPLPKGNGVWIFR